MEELKKCPFCGELPYQEKSYLAECDNEKCTIQGVYMHINDWNKRVDSDSCAAEAPPATDKA